MAHEDVDFGFDAIADEAGAEQDRSALVESLPGFLGGCDGVIARDRDALREDAACQFAQAVPGF